MTDSLLYSETDEHLANLDHCGSRDLRRAYLAIVMGALRVGYQVIPRPKGAIRELQIRQPDGNQPFAVVVNQNSLLFYLRQPALRADPDLADKARAKFAERLLDEPNGGNEVRILLRTERDAEDIAEWLFNP
ncbi:hypothetical protein [Sandarakinorhabdus sp. DWP1-3-1]|uniref:hypothetical protein n=1 Tax=Sandarakinorhabdus sp. DWP1-3-1 TaxID=2804627 RepID=UPI003CECCEEB